MTTMENSQVQYTIAPKYDFLSQPRVQIDTSSGIPTIPQDSGYFMRDEGNNVYTVVWDGQQLAGLRMTDTHIDMFYSHRLTLEKIIEDSSKE